MTKRANLPDLKNATPRCASEDHVSQMTFYRCVECNPFEHHDY